MCRASRISIVLTSIRLCLLALGVACERWKSYFNPIRLWKASLIMAPISDNNLESAALAKRKELTGAPGPLALVKNIKVFGIACFACLGG